MYLNLEAQVLLDNLDISKYIIDLKRNHNLCGIMQTFSIILDKTILEYLDTNNIELKPSNTIVIYEFGTKVLTGHVRTVKRSRTPDYLIQIDGTDTYKYAKDYFIDESFGTSNGESVLYWTTALLNLSGLDLIVDNGQISQRTVGPGIEFTLRTVDDALSEVISYAGGYLYTDADGVVHIQKGAVDSPLQFTGTSLNTTTPQELIGHNVIKATHKYNDENTRDHAKVWGFKGNIILRSGESPYIISEDSVNLNLPVPKTVIYSSNYVQTQNEANRLSTEMIQSLGKFDSIKVLETVGNPDIKIGKSAYVNVNLETSQLTETCNITGVASDISKDGYTMQVTLDEFCPRFAGWELAQPPLNVYAGTTKNGVYKSLDRGVTWVEYNDGLLFTNKNAKRIAADTLDQTMAIINQSLYKRTPSTTWTKVTLPPPTPTDDPLSTSFNNIVTVDNTTNSFDNFFVLTSYADHRTMTSGVLSTGPVNRSWVYETTDFGVNWTSRQIHDGTDYNFYGTDMTSKYGIPYVITSPQVEVWSNQYGTIRLIKSKPFKRAWERGYFGDEHAVDNHCVNDFIFYNPITDVYGPIILPYEMQLPFYGVSPKPSHGESLISINSTCYLTGLLNNENEKPEPLDVVSANLYINNNPNGVYQRFPYQNSPSHNTINGHFYYGTKIYSKITYPYGMIGICFYNNARFASPNTVEGFTGCTSAYENAQDGFTIYYPRLSFDAYFIEWEFY